MDEDQYTLGLNYRLLNNSSAYASYTRSTRFPVLDEFFSYTDNSINSELKEQTTDGFEAGLRIRHESGMAVSVNLFRLETEDEIFYNPYNEDNIYGANDNLDGDTVRRGVELTISHEFDALLLTGSYTYRDTEIEGGRYDGKEIPNVPDHQWTLGAMKTFGKRFQLGLNGTYVGERRFISDYNNDFGNLDDYFYVTSKLSYLLDNGSLYVAVNNLLNEEYSEYGVLSLPVSSAEEGFYPSPKINFVVGAQLRF
jgi:iron complex outermembrane receptor protein